MGFNTIVTRLIGNIPAPIIGGYLIDGLVELIQ